MASFHRLPIRWSRILTAALVWVTSVLPGVSLAAQQPEPEPPAPITSIERLWQVSTAQLDRVHPFHLELVVHYYDPHWKLLWGSDGREDAFIPLESVSERVRSGQRIRVEGQMVPARGLPLAEARITVLSTAAGAQPLDARGRIGDAARFNPRLVIVEGYVNRQSEVDPNHLLLDLAVEGRPIAARVLTDRGQPIPQVEGALVRLIALYVAATDAVTPEVKIDLWVPSPAQVEVIGWLEADPRFDRPAVPIERLAERGDELVRVVGTVRAQVPGSTVIVRDETGEVIVKTGMTRLVDAGVEVEAIGYPGVEREQHTLRAALFRPTRRVVVRSAAGRGRMLLRMIDQVRALSVAEAELRQPVRLAGVVTWSHPETRFFFLRDSSGGTRVDVADANFVMPPMGTRVAVEGVSTAGDFAPAVAAHTVTFSNQISLPEARSVSFEHAMTGVEEGERISLSGFVRAVAPSGWWTRLELTTAAGEFVALMPEHEFAVGLVGSVVRLQGICTAVTNAQRQLVGVQLWVGGEADVTVEEPAPADPFRVPLRTIASLRQFSTLQAVNHRVRISGVVLNQEPGVSIDLQEGTQSLRVLARSSDVLVPGDRIEAVGFAGRQGQRVVLREAVWRRLGHPGEPAAQTLSSLEGFPADWDGRLVKVEGRLVDVGVQPTGYRLLCQSGTTAFEAQLNSAQPMPAAWSRGSQLALTGVYEIQRNAYGRAHALQLTLRSPADVQVLRGAPWWTVERALAAAGVLVVAVLLGLVWVNVLQHRVARQTGVIREQVERAARLEMELVRSSKLESLGVLAGGIAHDFNNLLTVVMGNLSLVLTEDRLDPEARTFLRESERAALRARDLTNQLLTFSKGGAPVRSAVALADVVCEAAGFAQHGSNVRCEFDFSSRVWPADVDKGQIAQVVHNIVINAIQAMPNGGVVRIALENDTLERGTAGLVAGRYVRMTIADNGIGIPAEHLARIFDPYFTTKERGSGLGLATVYSIVKKHGGHIEVRSRPGEGTVFRIWLPAATRPIEEPTVSAPGIARWAGRVLVMDDEDSIRRFMSALLERLGFRVTAVADGEAAVREYAAAKQAGDPFSLVILDLTVPAAMGGADAMQHLRVIDPAVRAIVSSGYAKDPIVANYRAFGFMGMMPKPYVVSDVVRVIGEVMEAVPHR